MRKAGKVSKKVNGHDEKTPVEDDEKDAVAGAGGEAGQDGDVSDLESVSDAGSSSSINNSKALKKKGESGKKRKLEDVSEGDDADAEDEDSGEKADVQDEEEEEEDEPLAKKLKKGRKKAKTSAKPAKKSKSAAKKAKKPASESESEEYEVEKVIDMREKGGKRDFLIRWKGYKPSHDTWEAEDGLNCDAAIKTYLDSLPPAKKAKVAPKKGAKGKKETKKGVKKDEDDSEEESTAEYEVEKILEVHHKKNGNDEFLVRWKGFGKKDDTWEPEANLSCPDLIEKFKAKVAAAKTTGQRELRIVSRPTERFTLSMAGSGRRLSRRSPGKQRATYHDQE